MVLVEIPTRNDIANYDFTIDLDDGTYFFEFKYNLRKTRWNINIYDIDRTILLSGIPLLTDVDIIGQYMDSSLFPGLLLVFDKKDEQNNPERDDLNDRNILLYDEG